MASKSLIFTILGIDRASPVYGQVGDAMDRMTSRGTRAMMALTASSVAAAGATVAALAAVPLAFAAVGAIAVKENTAVRDSVADLGETVRTGLAADARPMATAYVNATREMGAAFQDLRPQIRSIFAETAPDVQILARGVGDLAREAMPGLVTATSRADVVFETLGERTLPATGRAVSGFFAEISEGAPAAAAFVGDLGDLAEGVLPRIGGLVANLSGLWDEHGDQIVRVIVRLTDTASTLAEGALPMVSDASGVVLDVLEGILAVVEPISDQLGPMIGTWMALSVVMRGFGAVRGVVDNVTSSVDRFRTASETAGGNGGVGRLATGVGGVMGLLGGPWGIAVTGAVALLAAFGQRSQSTAADQRSLAASLRESGGEFDRNARQAVFNSDQYKNLKDSVEAAGLTQGAFIDTVIEGGAPLENLRSKLEAMRIAGEHVEIVGNEMIVTWTDQGLAAKNLLDGIGPLGDMVAGAAADFEREQEALRGATGAMISARPGAEELREAMATLGQDTASTADQVDALNTAWRDLFGIAITLEQATANFEAGLDEIRESITGVKDETSNWRAELFAADGSINVTTEAGRGLLDNLVAQGESYRELALTARNTALSQGRSQQEATAAAATAVEIRRAQFISEQIALGLTRQQAEALANRYLGMPTDVLTQIQLRGTRDVENALDQLTRPRTVVISSVAGPMQARAGGGPVVAGQMYRVGEQGEELFVPHTDGVIIPHQPTGEILRELAAIGSGRASATTAARPSAAASGNAYHFHFSGPVGSRQQLEDWLTDALDSLGRQGRL